MGIPKFFRWISERYPLCSELIQEKRIPEFDNLYLDMNGIIHNCSHPNDDDSSFRITEAQIFLAIFAYLEHLFTKIKPRKLFFLAVDGVAPRAKMNQQRARRFRSALDAQTKRDAAARRGEEIPQEPPFDSNCITPGTPFMGRLQEQLKYFINKKISEDPAWQNVQVVLSGHNVPGEGEHKIMEYIRLAKSRDDYNPNTRHCLYGLDADLMMLGLLSHEPHFSLLREEVTFGGRKSGSTTSHSVENVNFYLLHLSIFREYLDLEFRSLKGSLTFEYDLERIIDDFILLSYFVGNDFLPSLPDLHINEGALATMFSVYKQVLPTAGGYINDRGSLNLERCQLIFDELARIDFENFKEKNKQETAAHARRSTPKSTLKKNRPTLSISQEQLEIIAKLKLFVLGDRVDDSLVLNATDMSMQDRDFAIRVAGELGLEYSLYAEDLDNGETAHFIELAWQEDEDDDDEESLLARKRVIRKYETAEVSAEADTESPAPFDAEQHIRTQMAEAKMQYYVEKFGNAFRAPSAQQQIVYHYVEGLQWVLYYYYQGVQSWEWFFPYHYSPLISDITNISQLQLTYNLSTPFQPFEQLMAVLPALSRQHIPPVLQDLLIDPNSPIIDFYPSTFELDMNGKKASWEAIVKIPFIDE
eukprot:jgi/Hompol1/4005/HPOL_001675-RA